MASPVPLVVTLHDIIFLESGLPPGGTWYQRLGNLYRRWTVPAAVRGAQAIATVSSYEGRRIREALPDVASRLHVVPNAVSLHFRPILDKRAQADVAHRYGLPRRFLFFLGNTDPKKNLPGTLEAYVRYVRAVEADEEEALPLVIADFDRERLAPILHALDAGDLADRFVLPGYIAHDDLPAVYTQCSLFLYPSLRESFGLPILEAMACGAPVLTSDCASMPEVAGDAAVLVDPQDPAAMAQALRRTLASPMRLLQLAVQGAVRARRYSWHRTAQQMLGVYEAVVDAASAPAETRSSEACTASSSQPGGSSKDSRVQLAYALS
jgi:glycosyltransferase involved in cell wall biosynthesis